MDLVKRMEKLYNELQKYIYHILFETNFTDKLSRIKKRSFDTKDRGYDIYKKEIPSFYESERDQYVNKLVRLKFRKTKNLSEQDKQITSKELKDLENRLEYIHASIIFFVKQFIDQEEKIIKLIEDITIERMKQEKIQNLRMQNLIIREPVDFSKTDLGKDTQRQVKIGLNVIQRITRSGFPYRATFSLQEIQKKIKQIFLDMFGEIDFVAIRTKSGKIRKYTVKKYIHMITRTEMTYMKNRAAVQSCREWSCDLVQASQHANPCPICAPHEGEIYSLSGKHPIYPPLDLTWMHPHCAHGIDPYSEVLGVAA